MFTHSQSNLSGKVVYKASYDKTLFLESSKLGNKEGVEGANELIKNATDVFATLSFNTSESSYIVDQNLISENENVMNISFYFAGGKDLYYYSRDSTYMLQTNSTLGKTYLIKREKSNWTITKETKLIDGLKCIKAYSSKQTNTDSEKADAIAWFCPEIPIDYGPMKYFGLPGLIIELKFSKMTFIADRISLNKEDIVVKKPKDSEIITADEFTTIAKKKIPAFFDN